MDSPTLQRDDYSFGGYIVKGTKLRVYPVDNGWCFSRPRFYGAPTATAWLKKHNIYDEVFVTLSAVRFALQQIGDPPPREDEAHTLHFIVNKKRYTATTLKKNSQAKAYNIDPPQKGFGTYPQIHQHSDGYHLKVNIWDETVGVYPTIRAAVEAYDKQVWTFRSKLRQRLLTLLRG